MSYLALYREWRPNSFKDIIGQEHITRTLQNALAAGWVSHAYLFCGPRGTGKTTTAKVLAKALNCRQGRSQVEPCNACENCREITAGNSMDVIEIDAASHRGIDEIRDLREKVRFSPTTGSYRVYIIDEVHMLTQEAFNALLKTLEEPPAHVVFVLATTEPQKVPLTILSRCQRFDFHRIGMEYLLARLKEVAQGAGLGVEESAFYLIARAAEGSLRDALSILDQVAAFGEKRINAEDIRHILGIVREEMLDEIMAAFSSHDIARVLLLIRSLVEQGKDLRLFVRELLVHLRNLLFLLISPELGEELSPPEKEKLGVRAKGLGREKLMRIMNILNRAEQEMKWSAQPRILLEVALVQAVRTGEDELQADLAQRVARLEELIGKLTKEQKSVARPGARLKTGPAKPAPADYPRDSSPGDEIAGLDLKRQPIGVNESTEIKTIPKDVHAAQKVPVEYRSKPDEEKKEIKPGTGEIPGGFGGGLTLKEVVARWPGFLETLKRNDPPLYSFLAHGWPDQLRENSLIVAFAKEHELYKEYLEGKRKEISLALNSFFIQDWQVCLVYGTRPQGVDFSFVRKELSTPEALTLFGVAEEK